MFTHNDFIVIDTEGKKNISEIAVFDHQGQLIYEAFNDAIFSIYEQRFNRKSLLKIIQEFSQLAVGKVIVCHSVEHDSVVLRRSFRQVQIPWQDFRFRCTYELAKVYFPNLPSYSLEYLSKHFFLRAQGKYFNPQLAHTAKYDAEFTYHLYQKIIQAKQTEKSQGKPSMEEFKIEDLKNKPNPFRSSRVDDPFQRHEDLKKISQQQFATLKQIIVDIKYDQNHQSMGAVVIGEAGSGKTHLMMRLAQEVLSNNRLLFIRQPNNPDAVMYHIYSRILESLIVKVPGSDYTQLEHLLAKSFTKLIREYQFATTNKTDQIIREVTKNNALDIYPGLQSLGATKNRQCWDNIEKRAIEWWTNEYGFAGYYRQILKGITRFCRYSDKSYKHLIRRCLSAEELDPEDLNKVGLENWDEEMGKEEFALQAMTVLSKLSRLDEPLIIVFDQLEALGHDHNRQILLKFGEAVKEIFTHVNNSLIILNLFPDRWEQFQEVFDSAVVGRVAQCQVPLSKPTREQLIGILNLKLASDGHKFTVEKLFSNAQLQDIIQQKSIRFALNSASEYYRSLLYNTDENSQTELTASSEYDHDLENRLGKLEKQFSSLPEVVNNLREELLSELRRDFLDKTYHNSPTESSQSSAELNKINSRLGKLEEKLGALPKIVTHLKEDLLSEISIDFLDKTYHNLQAESSQSSKELNKLNHRLEKLEEKLEEKFSSLPKIVDDLLHNLSQKHIAREKSSNIPQVKLQVENNGNLSIEETAPEEKIPEKTAYPAKTSLEIYLEQQHQLIKDNYSDLQIINDADDIGKMIQIAEAFSNINYLKLDSLRLGKRKIPEHIWIQTLKQNTVIAFLSVDGNSFTARIKNFNDLVVQEKDFNFYLFRDARKPKITSKVGKLEKEKLGNTTNGIFITMTKEQRVNFELIYKLVIDFYNQDLPFEVNIEELLQQLTDYLRGDGLIKLLTN